MHFPLADGSFPSPGGGSRPRAQVSCESLTCFNILAESHPHSPWQVHPTAGLTVLICMGGRSTSETAQHMWPQMELFIISFPLHPYVLTHPANCPPGPSPQGRHAALGLPTPAQQPNTAFEWPEEWVQDATCSPVPT